MKGWRPSAGQGLEPDRALFKRTYSCRTSDRSPVFSTGPGAFAPWTPGSPFRSEASRPPLGANGVHVKAIETAPALLREIGGRGNEDKRNENPMQTHERLRCPAPWPDAAQNA